MSALLSTIDRDRFIAEWGPIINYNEGQFSTYLLFRSGVINNNLFSRFFEDLMNKNVRTYLTLLLSEQKTAFLQQLTEATQNYATHNNVKIVTYVNEAEEWFDITSNHVKLKSKVVNKMIKVVNKFKAAEALDILPTCPTPAYTRTTTNRRPAVKRKSTALCKRPKIEVEATNNTTSLPPVLTSTNLNLSRSAVIPSIILPTRYNDPIPLATTSMATTQSFSFVSQSNEPKNHLDTIQSNQSINTSFTPSFQTSTHIPSISLQRINNDPTPPINTAVPTAQSSSLVNQSNESTNSIVIQQSNQSENTSPTSLNNKDSTNNRNNSIFKLVDDLESSTFSELQFIETNVQRTKERLKALFTNARKLLNTSTVSSTITNYDFENTLDFFDLRNDIINVGTPIKASCGINDTEIELTKRSSDQGRNVITINDCVMASSGIDVTDDLESAKPSSDQGDHAIIINDCAKAPSDGSSSSDSTKQNIIPVVFRTTSFPWCLKLLNYIAKPSKSSRKTIDLKESTTSSYHQNRGVSNVATKVQYARLVNEKILTEFIDGTLRAKVKGGEVWGWVDPNMKLQQTENIIVSVLPTSLEDESCSSVSHAALQLISTNHLLMAATLDIIDILNRNRSISSENNTGGVFLRSSLVCELLLQMRYGRNEKIGICLPLQDILFSFTELHDNNPMTSISDGVQKLFSLMTENHDPSMKKLGDEFLRLDVSYRFKVKCKCLLETTTIVKEKSFNSHCLRADNRNPDFLKGLQDYIMNRQPQLGECNICQERKIESVDYTISHAPKMLFIEIGHLFGKDFEMNSPNMLCFETVDGGKMYDLQTSVAEKQRYRGRSERYSLRFADVLSGVVLQIEGSKIEKVETVLGHKLPSLLIYHQRDACNSMLEELTNRATNLKNNERKMAYQTWPKIF